MLRNTYQTLRRTQAGRALALQLIVALNPNSQADTLGLPWEGMSRTMPTILGGSPFCGENLFMLDLKVLLDWLYLRSSPWGLNPENGHVEPQSVPRSNQL